MRSCPDVHNCLCEAGVAHEIVHLPALADTARRAADLLGVPLAEVVKTLLFYLDTRPALVLVPGDRQASPDLICAAAGCSEVVLARPYEVVQITGFRAGALPPCGLALPLRAFADPDVFASPVVYCGGGTTTTMLKLRNDDLRRVVQPVVAPVAEPTAADAAPPAGPAEVGAAPPARPAAQRGAGPPGERGSARRPGEE
jgi:prolyl-tRNA editing enzyme YbaK/EbsC (Cys-tRNA(Pro) deacylase)